MPKIDAPTVREHHAMVKAKLVAATEQILHEKGPEGLSAGAVAKRAGIARNSIYRYVDSVEDLKFLALEQYVPRWIQLIFSQVHQDSDPAEQLADFAVASLRQTRESSHGWLMSIMRTSARRQPRSSERIQAEGDIQDVHSRIGGFIKECWDKLGVEHPEVWAGYSQALIFESFKLAESGVDLEVLLRNLRSSIMGLTSAARLPCETPGS